MILTNQQREAVEIAIAEFAEKLSLSNENIEIATRISKWLAGQAVDAIVDSFAGFGKPVPVGEEMDAILMATFAIGLKAMTEIEQKFKEPPIAR